MKFDALRSSVARLFETAATLVSPQTGALERSNAPLPQVAPNDLPKQGGPKHLDWLRENGKSLDANANAKKAGLVAGKVTPDGFMPLPEPTIALGLERAPLTPAGLKSLINTKTEAEAKAAEIQKAIRDAMPGADVHVKVIGTGEDINTKILQDIVEQAKCEGIEPPPVKDLLWSEWTGAMASLDAPRGWATCSIGNRRCSESGKPEDDTVEFTFGFARGSFAVWLKPLDVCELVNGPDFEIKESSRILTVVTHLQSGTGMGLFFDMALAAEACELIERSIADLNAFDPNNAESWSPLFNRIVSIWSAAGIHRATAHAHVTGSDGEESPPIAIFERTAESMNYGRPEKLS